MRLKKRYTIRNKMIITFVPLILVALIVITFSTFYLYSNSLKNSYENLVNETIKQVNLHLDTYLNEIIRLTHIPYYNKNIMAVLENDSVESNVTALEETQIMDRELYSMLTTWRQDIQGIYFYRDDGKMFSKSRYRTVMNPHVEFLESNWYKDISKSRTEEFFISELNSDGVTNRPKRAFSVARPIQLYNQPSLAVLVIDINYTGLKNLIATVDIGENTNVFIVDDQDNIIMSKNNKYMGSIKKVNFSRSGIQEFKLNEDSFLAAFVESNTTEWKIVSVVSKREIFSEITVLQNFILSIVGVIIVLITGACIIISYRITKPLTQLNKLMKEIKKGNYKTSMKQNSNDEIGDLARTFNQMKDHIDELIHQVLEVKFKQKETELNSLKYQIRPHFLYNTLESIRALSEMKGNFEIVEMSTSLGAFLRYSIKEHNNLVTVQDEITQIKNYINIQQLRFGSINVIYNIDPRLSKCKIIPLILQPLVENAIQHGFAEKLSDRCLTITGEVIQSNLIIEVGDNGGGISQEQVDKLNSSLAQNNHDHHDVGIGLKNVDSRIKMTFGETYGLNIQSQLYTGTKMRLSLPYLN